MQIRRAIFEYGDDLYKEETEARKLPFSDTLSVSPLEDVSADTGRYLNEYIEHVGTTRGRDTSRDTLFDLL